MADPDPPKGPPAGTPPYQIDAREIIDTYLRQLGLTNLPRGWVWHEITGAGLTDPTAIAAKVELDLQTTTAFKERFPGLELRQKAGLPAITVAQYLSYEDQANQLARAAGLPQGFMNRETIGKLIGADVSASELSQRVNDGYAAAMKAPPETRELLNKYYGIDLGHLAAYFLDPTHALPMLQQRFLAAQIGTQGVESGFGDIGQATATHLAQLGISQGQAAAGFATLAPLTALETSLPGAPGSQGSPANVTGGQLVAAQFEGSGAAQLAVQHAQETREAPAKGGGGFALSQQGLVGAGFGNT